MSNNERLKVSLSDIGKIINIILHKVQDGENVKAILMLLELEKIIDELDKGYYDLIIGSYTKIVKEKIE